MACDRFIIGCIKLYHTFNILTGLRFQDSTGLLNLFLIAEVRFEIVVVGNIFSKKKKRKDYNLLGGGGQGIHGYCLAGNNLY